MCLQMYYYFFFPLSQLHFLTQERTIACSGEREQMSAAVAQRLQKEPSTRFLGKLKRALSLHPV